MIRLPEKILIEILRTKETEYYMTLSEHCKQHTERISCLSRELAKHKE